MNPNTDFIPFARPSLGDEEEEAVLQVIRSGWLTTGGVTRSFEEEFSRYCGSRFSLAVNSATAGLHLSLEALGVGPGDWVITTPYTFTATAMVVKHLGADPLFVDIEQESFNISVQEIVRALERIGRRKRIRGILPVHVAGHPCRMEQLLSLSKERGIFLLEDAAHAFPSRTSQGFIGTLGTAGVFSFYATKTITTGEGGMVVTDDESLARRISLMRLHGIDREIWNRYTSPAASWQYAVVEPGFKYNLTDLASAIGRVQLRKADRFLERRRSISRIYTEHFQDRSYLRVPPDAEGHAWHLYLLRIVPEELRITRDEYIEKLREMGIGTSVHFIPLHLHPYWQRTYGFKPEDFPEALKKYREVISLPIYPGLTESQIERIIQAVLRIGDAHYKS
ncbi:MAG: DegT/DnrJ/EryC1/StrS aminotransferase family protein [Spirochaetales bacterium]